MSGEIKMSERTSGRRLGYFEIGMGVLTEETWGINLALFSHVVITDAEAIPERNVVRYLAFSPLFDEIGQHEDYPSYAIVVEQKAGELPKVRAERKA